MHENKPHSIIIYKHTSWISQTQHKATQPVYSTLHQDQNHQSTSSRNPRNRQTHRYFQIHQVTATAHLIATPPHSHPKPHRKRDSSPQPILKPLPSSHQQTHHSLHSVDQQLHQAILGFLHLHPNPQVSIPIRCKQKWLNWFNSREILSFRNKRWSRCLKGLRSLRLRMLS